MFKRKIIACSVLSFVFSIGSLVFADHGHHYGKMDKEVHIDKMAKELDLTETQKEQIKNIMEEKAKKIEEIWAQMDEIRNSTKEKIKSVLTDEQNKKFESFHSKHHGHKHKHGEKCDVSCCMGKE